MCGSSAVDTAIKTAIAYFKAKGEGHRHHIVGRERGYHGMNIGGISVGGMVANRKTFSSILMPNTHHLRHTHLPENTFVKGEPETGEYLADDLERIAGHIGGENIAACIVEPVAGSTGTLVPPKGYLQKLRQICDKHGILLIFDEVITGFGRLGTAFASQYFNVTPDLICLAKGINSGTVPMGAVLVQDKIFEAFMNKDEKTIDLFHGYTYSAHPLACAASLATLKLYEDEKLFERANELSIYWEDAVHSLKGVRNIIDIRNLGLIGAVELEPMDGKPTRRAYNVLCEAFENQKTLLRVTGDIIALSPPLIIQKNQIDQLIDNLKNTLQKTE